MSPLIGRAGILYAPLAQSVSRDNLVLEYLFQGNLLDTSPSGYNLTQVGGGTVASNYYISSGGGYLTHPDVPLLEGSTAWTVCFWVYFDSLPGNNSLVLFGRDATSNLYFYIWENKFRALANPGNRFGDLSNIALTAGSWYHFAATLSSGTIRSYVNGALQSGTITGVTMGDYARPILINESGSYNMRLDDVLVYDGRVLTADEINIHVANGRTS
jgi:hypothetical protein